jgi:hypothetical protein
MAEAEPKPDEPTIKPDGAVIEQGKQNQEGAAPVVVEGAAAGQVQVEPGEQGKAKEGVGDGQPTPTPAELALQKKMARMDRKFQKRIARVTKQKNAAQQKLDDLQSEKPAAGAKATPPDPDAYSDDPDAYWAAFRAYEAGEDHEPTERKPKPAAKQGKDEQTDTAPEDPDVSDAIDDIRDAIDDSPRAEQIRKVFTDPSLDVSRTMILAIANLDDPSAAAEYLGENPELATKIAAMDELHTAIAIGKIEAKAGKANARRVSKAPAPIEPERGGGVINADPSKLSFAEKESQFLNSPGRDPTEW